MIGRGKKAILLILALLCVLTALLWYVHWRTTRFDGLIRTVAGRYQLDFVLVKALIHEESWFDPDARGQSGEIGLMQVSPIVELEYRQLLSSMSRFKPDLREPADNLSVGCWYLRQSLDIFRNYRIPMALALARYNAGESRVKLWIRLALEGRLNNDDLSESMFLDAIDIPSTRDYVTRILRRYRNRQTGWL